jgi:transposase
MDSPPRKRARGKSDTKKSFDERHRYSVVKCKLKTAVRKSPLKEPFLRLVSYVVENMNKIMFEAYMLLDYHVTRCMEEGLDLPKLCQTFYGQCCSAVTDTANAVEDPELKISMEQFRLIRSKLLFYTIPKNKYMSRLKNIVARTMVTEVQNHIALNIKKRIARYLFLKENLHRSDLDKFMMGTYRSEAYGNEPWPLIPVEKMQSEDQKRFLAWLPTDPSTPWFEENAKKDKHLPYYIKKTYEMLQFMDSLPNDTKGKRTFSLMPLKDGFVYSHVRMERCDLQEILNLLEENERKLLLESVLSQLPLDQVESIAYLTEVLEAERYTITQKMFASEHKWIGDSIWRYFINPSCERGKKFFAYQWSTNGYEASLVYQVPKTETELLDLAVDEYALPPNLFAFDRFVAIDPGRRDLVTAVWGEDDKDGKMKSVHMSTAEYRTHAKIKEASQYDAKLKAREPELKKALQGLPSMKTSSSAKLLEAIAYRLEYRDRLMELYNKKQYRAKRFKTFIYREKALHGVCKRLKGDSKTPCFGLGDWSKQSAGFLKGSPSAPVKKLRKVLKRYGPVVLVNECKTSQICSLCHHPEKMENVYYEGVDARDGVTKPLKCHEVVRCTNESCSTFWQRDVNAARNIFHIFQTRLRGGERPQVFQRKQKRL